MISIALLLSAAADMVPPAPLQPTGKWTVDYRVDKCLASRTFGPKNAEVVLAIEPPIVMSDAGGGFLFLLANNDRGKDVVRGTAKVTSLPAATNVEGDYVSWQISPVTRGWGIAAANGKLDLDDAIAMRLDMGKTKFTLQTGPLKPVLAALQKCTENLMRTWGLDPAASAKPIVNPGRWFNDDDYPGDAKNEGAQGRSTIIMTVAADGRPTACRTVVPTKFTTLDRVTCNLAMKRGRFEAAPGKNDRYSVLTIRWVMRG